MSDFPAETEVLLSTQRLQGIDWVESANNSDAWFLAGSTVGFVFRELEKRGRTLSVPIWISEATIGSLTQVDAHSNGIEYGAISTVVTGFEMILANGTLARFSEDTMPGGLAWDGVRVGLGMLGMVARVRVRTIEDWPLLVNTTCEPLDTWMEELETRMAVHKSYIWLEYYAGTPSSNDRLIAQGGSRMAPHELPEAFQDPQKWGVPVPVWKWNLAFNVGYRIQQLTMILHHFGAPDLAAQINAWALEHFLDNTGCATQQLLPRVNFVRPFDFFGRSTPRAHVFELFVPLEHCMDAVRTIVEAMNTTEVGLRHFLMVRPVKASQAWMSPMYGQDVCGIDLPLSLHWVRYADRAAVMAFNMQVVRLLEPYGPRPHWGKGIPRTFFTDERFRELYPRFDEFKALRLALDPTGTFRYGWPF